MPPRSKTPLFDIAHAALGVAAFINGKSFDDYRADVMLRMAIERQFTILGEALVRLRKEDPATASQITDFEKIIGFRNVLVHGCDTIDDELPGRSVTKNCRHSQKKQ